jgi:TRAP-type mannitol/chloroaromatic compound transport system permease small subunit
MNRLKKFMIAVDKVNMFTGKVMAYVLVLCIFIITYEVIMRYLFNRPTIWAHESMTLMFAILYVILGGYCHYYRAHVRVDVFYSSRSPRAQAILDLFTSVFFFIFATAYTYTSWKFYWSSQTMLGGGKVFGIDVPGELSFTDWGPPLYCVKFMMPLAGVMLLLQGINWFIRDLHMAIKGREMT